MILPQLGVLEFALLECCIFLATGPHSTRPPIVKNRSNCTCANFAMTEHIILLLSSPCLLSHRAPAVQYSPPSAGATQLQAQNARASDPASVYMDIISITSYINPYKLSMQVHDNIHKHNMYMITNLEFLELIPESIGFT